MHTPQPLPPPKGSLSKQESGASEPQPTSSCPGRHPLPRRLQVLPRHTPRLAPSESRSDTFRDPAVHTPPAGRVWGLEPQTQDQVLPLAPTPRHPELAPYLVPPACFRGSCSHAWPSAGQPVHGLQEGSRVSGQPATQKPCLTGLCRLCCARTVGLGRAGMGLAAGPPQLLTTCPLVRRRLVAASRPCCAGPDPGGTARGCLASVPRPSAAASFELPTPLWSLYMPPEETVSTA